MRTLAYVAMVLVLAGCNAGGVQETDMAKARQELSQENYEKAMIAAGKGAELEKEKAAAASRGEGQ